MPTQLRVAKDPDDIEDLTWDWSARLTTGETISTFTATSSDVTVASDDISGTSTIARVSGGTAGTLASVLGRITTSAGRQLDWTIQIPVEAQ